MKRTYHIWILFALCLAVVLAAMGWISLAALELDRKQAEARRQTEAARQKETAARRKAEVEENVQLALWRMDYALTPLVAQESIRPYFAYSTFLPVDRAYDRMFNYSSGPERLVPSPLLAADLTHALVHFQFEPDGRVTSPQVPTAGNRELAVPKYISQEAVHSAEVELARLRQIVDVEHLLATLPESTSEPVPIVVSPILESPQQRVANVQFQNDAELRGRGFAEFNRRNQTFQQNVMAETQAANQLADVSFASTTVGGALMTPLWRERNLILARRISVGGRSYVQGCLLNWPEIETTLLLAIEDLLPEARLEPVEAEPGEDESHLLAALPLRLIPGRLIPDEQLASSGTNVYPTDDATVFMSPIRLSLCVAWGCVMLAAAAVAALLSGVIRLSERRAAFVSAVTHELRTPLTTFYMYTEMLAEGMVPEPKRQQDYLSTLRSEASRLSHLVENVLAYARLERGRADGQVENLLVEDLIRPIEERIANRVRQSGMELLVERDQAALSTIVRTNPSAVEQILLNLVDNAGKYAAGEPDKRLHLRLTRTDGRVQLSVRDHGPGIPPPVHRRLFRSFSKSAHEAANSAPGIGLGLALSRRLARDMGGRLELDKTATDGACFVLTLPISSESD